MDRARRPGGRRAEHLPQQIRQAREVVEVKIALGHGVELVEVLHLLIRVAVAPAGLRAAGDGDQRRVRHERIAQAGREVRRADLLREAHARRVLRARVAVGHVHGGLLAVREYLLYAEAVRLRQRVHQYGRHEEYVRNAVALEYFGDQSRTRHLRHFYFSCLGT